MDSQSKDLYDKLRRTEGYGIRSDPVALERATKLIWAQPRLLTSTRTITHRPPPLLPKEKTTCSTLPFDILRRIFYIYLSDGGDGTIQLPMRQEDPVWILCRVCSSWRQLISSEALIWARLHIRFSPTVPNGARNDVSKTCLRRSGEFSLHLSISCNLDPGDYCRQSRYLRGFFSTILKYSSGRIQTLVLDIGPAVYPHLTAAAAQSNLTFANVADLRMILTSFKLHSSGYGRARLPYAVEFLQHQATSRMPKLSRITLGTKHPGLPWDSTTNIIIPWTQLTHISLDSSEITLNAARIILQGCNRLVFLSLQVRGSDTGWGLLANLALPKDLPALRHLALGSRSAALWLFLESLHAPSLDHLRIFYSERNVEAGHGWDFEDESTYLHLPSNFAALITSFERLKTLELVDVRPVDYLGIIRDLPFLERLDACTSGVFPVKALQSILVGECGQALTHLQLALTNAGIMALFDLIGSQWKSVANESASGAIISHARIVVVEPGKRLHDTFNKMAAKLKESTQGQFDILFLPP